MPEKERSSDKDQVSKWHNRIKDAKSYKDKQKQDQHWERYVDQYQGKYDVGKLSEQMAIIPINLVYAYIHTEIPRLYFRDPFLAVNPKGFAHIKNAKILEVVINYLMGELNIKSEFFKVLLDTLLIGHGWVKFGYSGTFGTTLTAEDVKGQGENKKPLDEVNEFVKSEEIFALHVPWEDIVFDCTAKDPPYDCHWIAHKIVKPLKSVQDSDLYINTSSLKANFKPKDNDVKTDIDLVELWEIWDKDSNSIYVITDGVEKFLRKIPNPYEMEGLPFSMLKFNPVPGKPYPLSDISILEPQFMEKIKLRSMQLNHLKRWNRQVFMEKGAIEENELSKYKTGQDGGIILVEPGSISGNKFFVPQYPTMQAEIFQIENLIQLDIDTISGQNQTDRGVQASTRTRTLGEVELMAQSSLTRNERRKDALEDFMEEVSRKIIQLVKQFQLTAKYARITEQDPSEYQNQLKGKFDGQGLFYTKADIQGDFDVEVRAGSTIPLSKENRLKILSQILSLGQNIGIMPGGPVAQEIGKVILRDLNVKEAEKAFVQQQQQIQKMQSMLGNVGGNGAVQPQMVQNNMQQMPGQEQVNPNGL